MDKNTNTIFVATLKKISGVYAPKDDKVIPDDYVVVSKEYGIPSGNIILDINTFVSNVKEACEFLTYSDLRSNIRSLNERISAEEDKESPDMGKLAWLTDCYSNLVNAFEKLPYVVDKGTTHSFKNPDIDRTGLYIAIAFAMTGSKSYSVKPAEKLLKKLKAVKIDDDNLKALAQELTDFINDKIDFRGHGELKNLHANIKVKNLVFLAQSVKKTWGKAGITTKDTPIERVFQQLLLDVFEQVFKLSAPKKEKKEREYTASI